MKKVLAVIGLLLFWQSAAFAQHLKATGSCTVGPNGGCVGLSWTDSTTAGAGYNVIRGTTSGGESSAPLNPTPLASGTIAYTDSTAVGGATYYYEVVATCTGVTTCPTGYAGSAAPSNEVNQTVPSSTPAPATGLNITSVAENFGPHNNVSVSASYTDVFQGNTLAMLWGRGKLIASNQKSSPSGLYTFSWKGNIGNNPNWFSVCDGEGDCATAPVRP